MFGAYFIFANISTVGSVKNLTLWSRVSVRDPRSVIRRYELSVMVLLWICYGGQGLANLNRHTTASTFMLVRPPLCTRFHEHWTCTLSRKKNIFMHIKELVKRNPETPQLLANNIQPLRQVPLIGNYLIIHFCNCPSLFPGLWICCHLNVNFC